MKQRDFVKGDRPKVQARFKNASGTLFDPQNVFGGYIEPGETEPTTYQYGVDGALVRVSTGIYYFLVDVDSSGDWWVGMWSTGTGKGAADQRFFVKASRLR